MNPTPLQASYNQIAVFWSNLANPFNDWTDAHVAQGFAWRPGSVSFATLDSGVIDVEVARRAPTPATSSAARIIVVPFYVEASGDLEVATIGDGLPLHLAPGTYRLFFEHGVTANRMWARFGFEPADSEAEVVAAVLRADGGLNPADPLVMHAEAAV